MFLFTDNSFQIRFHLKKITNAPLLKIKLGNVIDSRGTMEIQTGVTDTEHQPNGICSSWNFLFNSFTFWSHTPVVM